MKKTKFETKSVVIGDDSLTYFVVPDTVVCIYKDENDNVLLVRQFRPIFDEYYLEVPGGSKDPDESINEAAVREFKEETGYVIKELELQSTVIASIGSSSEKIHIFKVISLEDGVRFLPEDNIEVVWMDINQALSFFLKAEVVDAKTLIALQLVRSNNAVLDMGSRQVHTD